MLTERHARKRKFFERLTILLSVLALTMSFPGCTRSDRKSAAAPEKITIAIAASPDAALVQVAQVKGFFRDEGLAVVPQMHSHGRAALQAVLEGKADFATVAETPVMFAVMNGEEVSIIATILSSNRNTAIIALAGKGIQAPPDLKGKKIACTFGTIGEFFMDSYLVSHGISGNEVKKINLLPEELGDALANGKVDAVSTFSPFTTLIQKKLGAKATEFHDEDIYTQTFNVAATREYIRRNPETVRRLLRSLVKADDYVRLHPVEAQQIVADFSKLDKTVVAELWAAENFGLTLDQSLILAMEDESQWALENKLVNRSRPPNYLDAVYLDGLASVEPKAVTIIR